MHCQFNLTSEHFLTVMEALEFEFPYIKHNFNPISIFHFEFDLVCLTKFHKISSRTQLKTCSNLYEYTLPFNDNDEDKIPKFRNIKWDMIMNPLTSIITMHESKSHTGKKNLN